MPLFRDVPGLLRLSDLPKSGSVDFTLCVSPEMTDRLVAALDLLEIRKIRLSGCLKPYERTDWRLQAQLGATVSQRCIATEAPVVTRIDCELERIYVANWEAHVPQDAETEMPEDDRFEPLTDIIDLEQLVIEGLALALPDFPRSDGIAPIEITARPAGSDPIDNTTTRPFAGLADLKRRLEEDG